MVKPTSWRSCIEARGKQAGAAPRTVPPHLGRNLTRFDVTSTRRTRAFHHYSVGGELEVEDVEVLGEDVESVECRWCGTGDGVEELPPES